MWRLCRWRAYTWYPVPGEAQNHEFQVTCPPPRNRYATPTPRGCHYLAPPELEDEEAAEPEEEEEELELLDALEEEPVPEDLSALAPAL